MQTEDERFLVQLKQCIRDAIEVFVYCDSEERDIATTEQPMLTVGQFACLHVNDVNDIVQRNSLNKRVPINDRLYNRNARDRANQAGATVRRTAND